MANAQQTSDRLGEFPFPLSYGPEESPYLTWIRNHSNYMAPRGLSDYTRAVAILLRGVLVNFLIFVPFLLLLSLAVAVARTLEVPPQFILTKILLALFAIWVVLFLLATPLFRIARYEKSRATGSGSSVKQRDRYERSFGAFLLVIAGIVALESLPGLLDVFHETIRETRVGWPTLASTTAFVAAVFGVAPRLVAMLGAGVARTLTLVAVGALGIVVPLVFVLFVADFLVSGPRVDWTIWALLASLLLPLGVLCAAGLGFALRAWRPRDYAVMGVLLVLSLALFTQLNAADRQVLVKLVDNVAHGEKMADMMLKLPEALQKTHLEQLGELSKLGEELAELRAYRESMPAAEPTRAAAGWPLAELAEAGEAAGLYPEFGRLLEKIRGLAEECEAKADPCDPLRQDLQLLSASAGAVRALAEGGSLVEQAQTLLRIPRTRIDRIRRARYPALSQALGLDADLEDAQEAFRRWGPWLRDARSQLIVDAYMSPDSLYYPTELAERGRLNAFWARFVFAAMLAVLLWAFCWLTIDVNLTSIHGLYRDRLASAFLVGKDTNDDVDIERDLDLMKLGNHAERSTAPYHLINVALNLQGSSDIGLRDRKSDFFIFSKRFIGGRLTGYCRSEKMEQVFPQMDLATAMAISAAAASPNMGRATSPALTAVMTLLNIRMGYWVPNPGLVEEREGGDGRVGGFSFEEVFRAEQHEIAARWRQLPNPGERALAKNGDGIPKPYETVEHGLVGIGFSGGGIRSAAVNLGITQALHHHGVFDHLDYMSTVSGGGYLGSSISALMRRKTKMDDDPRTQRAGSAGTVHGAESAGQLFRWRVRPLAVVREILGKVHEKSRLVNVSDGGHIENLAGIELLRRRCRYVIIGDGEADPKHHFTGLATLIRTARLDLGIHIDIKVDSIRRSEKGLSQSHWALGRVHYPGEESGYLLYLKSSVTGEEDEVIANYRNENPSFPHEKTADQMFSEGQFEAYRSLGQHIGEKALAAGANPVAKGGLSFRDLERWFEGLAPRNDGSELRSSKTAPNPTSP